MSMEEVLRTFTGSPRGRLARGADVVDRLSTRYTPLILVTFAVVVGYKQWAGKPLICWVPKHFSGNDIKYTLNYCLVSNTYYLPYTNHIPKEHEHDKKRNILYYQWLPFIFMVQALLFYVPCRVWNSLSSKASADCEKMIQLAGDLHHEDTKEENLSQIREHFARVCASYKERSFLPCLSRSSSSYLFAVFIFSKLLCIINLVFQILILSKILKTNFSAFSWEYFRFYSDPVHDKVDFANSPIFPRMTMCDLKIRMLGNIHRYTVQCVLSINMFVESMYLFLWFWMSVLLLLSIVRLVSWLYKVLMRSAKRKFIQGHLMHLSTQLYEECDDDLCRTFVDRYLKRDGLLALRLISHNTNSVAASEVVCGVWKTWRHACNHGNWRETNNGHSVLENTKLGELNRRFKRDDGQFEEVDEVTAV